jgi:hypothetical protein
VFAAIVYHVVNPEFMAGESARLDAASRAWGDYLAARPGFVEYVSLRGGKDRAIALTLWRSEVDFKAMLADPGSNAARAAFAGMFSNLTPEFLAVTGYRRAESRT